MMMRLTASLALFALAVFVAVLVLHVGPIGDVAIVCAAIAIVALTHKWWPSR